jgi:hypothetical protein
MDLLRWWFTAHYDAVATSHDRDIFELRGQGVRVLSENQMLTTEGRRVATGQSDALNGEFAHRFTQEFESLARMYPIYAELQNVFDLALAASLIKTHRLTDRAGWHMTHFGADGAYAVDRAAPPAKVESVINHRVVRRTQIVAAVSGGVRVDVERLAAEESLREDRTSLLKSERSKRLPEEIDRRQWWWD